MVAKAKVPAERHDVMTVAQVADYLQLNKLTVYRYIREGKLPAIKLGRTFRIMREDIHWFLDAQRAAPERPAWSARKARALSKPATLRPEHQTEERRETYVDPRSEDSARSREALITYNPLDWVIRGLH